MKIPQQTRKSCQADAISSLIRVVILVQAITFLFNSIAWFMKDDLDKWFTRWALGMLLLSAWGIMKHISRTEQLVCDACKIGKKTNTLEDCKCGKGQMWVKAN
jgi:hypothetical protein